MKIKCEYCGAFINEKDEFCNSCGAVNANFKRATDGTPKTINELKAWYASKNLPPQETTRFFIGVNYKEPKAFGIYEENGEFIVYKNKDDGSRAIRYQGSDEAYAVNELYLKLKQEILNQKAHNINKKAGGTAEKEKESLSDKFYTLVGTLLAIAFIGGFAITAFNFVSGMINGARDLPYAGNYYKYANDVYYCNSYVNDDWYWFDDSSKDYVPVTLPTQMYDDIQSYKFSNDEQWDTSIEKFGDTEIGKYVNSLNESSSDDDNDYSWDSSDSWDSDSSDWGSDW